MSDTSKSQTDLLQDQPLTVREHLDPDKHWIGETLAVPTQTEIAATVGSVSGPGDSPYAARADHLHKLGTGVVQTANIANGSITNVKLAAENTNQTLIRRRMSRSTAQNCAATTLTQLITAGAANDENVGGITYSAGDFVVPVAGTYAINLACYGGGTIPAGGHLTIFISGTNTARVSGTGNTNQSLSLVAYVGPANTIQFYMNNTTAAAFTVIPSVEIVRIAS